MVAALLQPFGYRLAVLKAQVVASDVAKGENGE